MSAFDVKTIRLEGQSKPYILKVEKGINCKAKVIQSGERELINLVIVVGETQYPLQFNDTNFLFFSGSGGLLQKTQGLNRLSLIDEYETENKTVYIFDKKEKCFWTRHIYLNQIARQNLPIVLPQFTFMQAKSMGQSDTAWSFYPDPKDQRLFRIIETRSEGFYQHTTESPVEVWGQGFDLLTTTDYAFFRRDNTYWLRSPDCVVTRLDGGLGAEVLLDVKK